jgi:hypothetical protein
MTHAAVPAGGDFAEAFWCCGVGEARQGTDTKENREQCEVPHIQTDPNRLFT